MQKTVPTAGRLATMVLFALSCFGLLLFLWTAFGGPTPLKPKGYRVAVSFDEATQLAEQADVRISGVPVGKVVRLRQDDRGRSLATLEIDTDYAPLSRDARAILRLKTLLGETFVELTPGTPGGPTLKENELLPRGQVAQTVELDEVLRGFDEPTRQDLKTWVTGWADALEDRGRDLSDVVGNLAPTAEQGASLLSILDAQERAVSTGTRDTGAVFGALGRRDAAVRTLISASQRVLRTTAAREDDLQRVLRVLPAFSDELRPTLAVAQDVARDAAPVVRALRPAAKSITPVLRNSYELAPDLEALFKRLDPVIRLTATALPAGERTVKALRPLLGILYPTARDLLPVADYLGAYRSEFATMWMNVAAATQDTFQAPGAESPVHYLRTIIPITNEGLVDRPQRLASNRHNAYLAPRGLEKLASGLLESFSCANTSNPQTIPVLGTAPTQCKEQQPPEIRGKRTAFPRLERDAP